VVAADTKKNKEGEKAGKNRKRRCPNKIRHRTAGANFAGLDTAIQISARQAQTYEQPNKVIDSRTIEGVVEVLDECFGNFLGAHGCDGDVGETDGNGSLCSPAACRLAFGKRWVRYWYWYYRSATAPPRT